MKISRDEFRLSTAWRRIAIGAMAGLTAGLMISHGHANYLSAQAARHIAAANLVAETGKTLSRWQDIYIQRHLPDKVANLLLSSERSHRLMESRRALIQSFERTLPVESEENTFLSDRTRVLREARR